MSINGGDTDTTMHYYRIKEAYRKTGEMQDVHREIIGCVCCIARLVIGRSAVILVILEYDKSRAHRILTSAVQRYKYDDNMVSITTNNSVYKLEKISEDISDEEKMMFEKRKLLEVGTE